MTKHHNLWLKIPRDEKCHLTKLTVSEKRQEIEFDRQWQEEIQNDEKREGV